MLVIETKLRNITTDVLSHKTRKLPRFRRSHFTGLTVRDNTLEIVRAKFKGLPDMPGATELYFPGSLGLFVYENLTAYLKLSKQAPVRKVSDREKYLSKIQ